MTYLYIILSPILVIGGLEKYNFFQSVLSNKGKNTSTSSKEKSLLTVIAFKLLYLLFFKILIIFQIILI